MRQRVRSEAWWWVAPTYYWRPGGQFLHGDNATAGRIEHWKDKSFEFKRFSYTFLDEWIDVNGYGKKINDMNTGELRTAISDIKKGYGCYGQRAKIISLEKALAKKRKVVK